MKDSELLDMYRPMVSFLAAFGGPSCEVVLHDVQNPKHSVIAIENGYHTKRKVGSPLTDFAKKSIESGAYLTHDYISNYRGTSKGKNFLSSTYFIKNEGRLIGMLCINRDISYTEDLENALHRLERQFNIISQEKEVSETLDESVSSMLQNTIHDEIIKNGGDNQRLSIADKISIVKSLKEKGILKMKGAVAETAKQLNVSEPTIYRYAHK